MIMKKGQAALEFLMTYGWAILVVLVSIGALAYFGILKPSKILPNRCTIGHEFQCLDFQISASGASPNPQFKLRLKNNVGEPIDVTLMTISTETTVALACTNPQNPTSWKSGEVKDFAWTSCTSFGGLIAGEKGKVLITLRYNSVASGSNYAKEVNGEVYSTII